MCKLPPRKNIPPEVERLVRQQCGFGCCMCGLPIIQYHHIIPRSENEKDIMLLCPNHHTQATDNSLSVKKQIEYRSNPFNITQGYVSGNLVMEEGIPVIDLGGNQVIGVGPIIRVDAEELLVMKIENNILFISLKLYDENNNLILEIKDNEWMSGDSSIWDIRSRYQHLIINLAERKIVLRIDMNKTPMEIRGRLRYNNQTIILTNKKIQFDGIIHDSSVRNLCFVNMGIKIDRIENKVSFVSLSDGPHIWISEGNVQKRIQMGLDKLKEMNT